MRSKAISLLGQLRSSGNLEALFAEHFALTGEKIGYFGRLLGFRRQQTGDYTPAVLTSWREVPSEALERQELGAMLRGAIDGLPEIYRNVVLLRDIEEMDVRETAAALGITEGAVKVRLHRARAMLQRELAPRLEGFAPKRRGLFGWFR